MRNDRLSLTSVIPLLLLVTLLAGQFALAAQRSSSAAIQLTDADSNKSIEVTMGQRIEIRLSANPTTGYSWLLQSFPPSLELSDFSYATKGKTMPGSGGIQTVTFIARSTEVGTVRLEYRRVWESKDTPAAKVFNVRITVLPAPIAKIGRPRVRG